MNRQPYPFEVVVVVFAISTLALMLFTRILGYYEQKGRKKNKTRKEQ